MLLSPCKQFKAWLIRHTWSPPVILDAWTGCRARLHFWCHTQDWSGCRAYTPHLYCHMMVGEVVRGTPALLLSYPMVRVAIGVGQKPTVLCVIFAGQIWLLRPKHLHFSSYHFMPYHVLIRGSEWLYSLYLQRRGHVLRSQRLCCPVGSPRAQPLAQVLHSFRIRYITQDGDGG